MTHPKEVIAPPGCGPDVTATARYRTIRPGETGFAFKDDDGNHRYSIWKGSHILNGQDWIIPQPECKTCGGAKRIPVTSITPEGAWADCPLCITYADVLPQPEALDFGAILNACIAEKGTNEPFVVSFEERDLGPRFGVSHGGVMQLSAWLIDNKDHPALSRPERLPDALVERMRETIGAIERITPSNSYAVRSIQIEARALQREIDAHRKPDPVAAFWAEADSDDCGLSLRELVDKHGVQVTAKGEV